MLSFTVAPRQNPLSTLHNVIREIGGSVTQIFMRDKSTKIPVVQVIQEKLKDVPAYTYMLGQFKENKVTAKRICRGEDDMQHMAETYLTLLDSVRKSEELTEKYKGRERTIQDSARLVGLQVPQTPAHDT